MKIQRLTTNRTVRSARQGFTLVEMLLVLVILATLAAIVYPKVMGRSEQARITAAQTQIANFKTALDSFEVDNGYYPKGRNGLMDLIQQPRDAVELARALPGQHPEGPMGQRLHLRVPGQAQPQFLRHQLAGAARSATPIGNWQRTTDGKIGTEA